MTPHIPKLADLRRKRDLLIEALQRLDDHTLAELHRRAGVSPKPLEQGAGPTVTDGFPAGGGAGRSSDVSRPTEKAALIHNRTTDGKDVWVPDRDPILLACAELFAGLSEASGIIARVDKQRLYVLTSAERAEGRVSSLQGQCGACGRDVSGASNDKLKAGYCGACYVAWHRADYPDRHAFEVSRRAAS